MIPVRTKAARILPTIAPASTPAFDEPDPSEEFENTPVCEPGMDVEVEVEVAVEVGRDRGGGVVLATIATPRANPSYGYANA